MPLTGPWVNEPGPAFAVVSEKVGEWVSGKGAPARVHSPTHSLTHSLAAPSAIRVPVTRVKGLTERTKERLLAERARGEFESQARGLPPATLLCPSGTSPGPAHRLPLVNRISNPFDFALNFEL